MIAYAVAILVWVIKKSSAEIDPTSYLNSQSIEPDYTINQVWLRHQHLPNFADLQQAAGDTFTYLPREYLPDYRSPCWRLATGEFKCLPYFQILGVSKCGTTDLYHRLTFNPNMIDCGWKGPHFWDESVYPISGGRVGKKYDGSFPSYVSVFDKAAGLIEQNQTRITGEASSNTYTGVLTYCRGTHWPRTLNVTLAQLLYEATPWARYIMLFRDPVDRYYSAFYYYRPKSYGAGTPEMFHKQAESDIKQWHACLQATRNNEHRCLQQYQPQQLIKGMYAAFLPYWLDAWPRNRLMILRTEDYKAAPDAHVTAAAKFLGLGRMSGEEIKEATSMSKANVKKYNAMLPETRKLLQDFYRPFNQRLSSLMEADERWLWGY